MLRAILAVIACLCLCSCWVSDTRFFGSDDWAKTSFSGEYDVLSTTDSDAPHHATLTTRADGLIELDRHDPEDEPTLIGLVPIAGGSGKLFLAVDRTHETDSDMYYLAAISDRDELAFYYPSCEGTPPREGLLKEGSGLVSTTCTFATEEALMAAALDAEHFLSEPHIVALAPFLAFSKPDQVSDD